MILRLLETQILQGSSDDPPPSTARSKRGGLSMPRCSPYQVIAFPLLVDTTGTISPLSKRYYLLLVKGQTFKLTPDKTTGEEVGICCWGLMASFTRHLVSGTIVSCPETSRTSTNHRSPDEVDLWLSNSGYRASVEPSEQQSRTYKEI